MPEANVRNLEDAGNTPEEWFKSLPFVTRYWFGLAVATTLAVNLGTVQILTIFYSFEKIKDNFEVWRFLTCFLYIGDFSFNLAIDLYMLYQYSLKYEKSGSGYNTGAGGGTADYVFAMIFAMIMHLVTYPFLTSYVGPLFGTNLIFFVMYIWSKRFPNEQVNVWFIPVQSLYLPFVLLGFRLFTGQPVFQIAHGMAIGHLYYFLADIVPLVYGKNVLNTPQFLIDQFGIGLYQPPPQQEQQQQYQAGAMPNPWNARGGGTNTSSRSSNSSSGLRRRNLDANGHDWGGGGRVLGGN